MKLENYLYFHDPGPPDIKIYCGDSFDVLPLMNPVDLVVCDPPYGIELGYDVYKDTEENWDKMFTDLIPALKKISTMSILPCCRIAKLPFIYSKHPPDWLICWYKGSIGHRGYLGFCDYEPLLVYGKNKGVVMHDYFSAKTDNTDSFYKEHPCPKSVEWYKWLIFRAIGLGQTFMTPFLGSGTGLVAAKELNLNGIGIELSEKYCSIAKKRLQNTQGRLL